ncbi:VOC family protein [Verrucomicrobia bacterium LW23]|nr:VOC family protein [Verrucomicrobia bacterium LW23]
MVVQAYLFFDGKCEEAFEFYKRAVEAKENVILRFKDSPEPCEGASGIDGNKIMHMSFTIGDTEVMASDGMCEGKIKHDGFSLAISTPSDAKTSEYFNALVAGGEVIMPVAKTFWSSSYGMLKDKFGVTWMVMTTPHGG